MAALLDGRALAGEMQGQVATDVARLAGEGTDLTLFALQVGDDPGTRAYGRVLRRACREVGMGFEGKELPGETSQSALLDEIEGLNAERNAHGILVHRPLPRHLDPHAVSEAVAPDKDVDGLHPFNLGRLLTGQPGLVPATPQAVRELLLGFGHPPQGKHTVVIGRSDIVGKPLAALLMQKDPGADATVTLAHSHTTDLRRHTRAADIVVVAVGRPAFLRGDMIRPGAVVIDVGINSVPNPARPGTRKLVGDVAFEEVAAVAGAISPVPGGVGPVTVAAMLRNTVQAHGWRQTRREGPSAARETF
ncbi:MAG: bifunctional 5,10-methylenetetrahydrofolate dehydrogenase/5,10-methenyltetrahydrofolate cyclohydrolase [Thermoplasmata archaeon]